MPVSEKEERQSEVRGPFTPGNVVRKHEAITSFFADDADVCSARSSLALSNVCLIEGLWLAERCLGLQPDIRVGIDVAPERWYIYEHGLEFSISY